MPSFSAFFTNLPSLLYFTHLACQIRDDWLKLDLKGSDNSFKLSKDYHNSCSLSEDANEKLLYLQDIFTLNQQPINNIVINSLMYYTVMPLVVCQIGLPLKKTSYINVNSSLFFLNQVFDALSYEPFHNIIVIIMLLHHVPKSLLTYSEELPRQPTTYSDKWVYKKNSQIVKLLDSIVYQQV
jgi:hypothetical protein